MSNPQQLAGDLRSDHAGETGAVMIYRGILAGTRDPALRRFAAAHLATESDHLRIMESLLPAAAHSALLPLWRIFGFLTGFLPALAGRQAVYATIEAVENFVDRHYEEQIQALSHDPERAALRAQLVALQRDELHHRDEARAARQGKAGWLLRGWVWLVGFGSRNAVAAARRL